MKKIIVVGAGITGCVISYYLSLKGHKVEIYDQADSIGGVMQDYNYSKKIYFSGPQYLDPNLDWFKKLFSTRELKKYFNVFSFSYGSFTDLFNEKIYFNNFAHPTTKKRFKKNNIKNKKFYSLTDRLNNYQNEISKRLIDWVKVQTNHYDNLHEKTADILAIGRLQFLNDNRILSKMKKKYKTIDKLIGIPDKNLKQKVAALPKKGNNHLFKIVTKKLKKKNIIINLKNKVYLKKNDGEINLYSGKKKLIADHYVWTANPVPLIRLFNNFTLDNPFVKSINLYFNVIKNPNKIQNYYAQIFSKNTTINRIFIYKINNKFKLTAEAVYKKNLEEKDYTKDIKKILHWLDPKIMISELIGSEKYLKHNLFTNKDFHEFKKFENIKNNKIISGSWYNYSRDKKIKSIIKNLNYKNL